MGALKTLARKIVAKDYSFNGDGFATRNKNLGFLEDKRFASAYEWSAKCEFSGQAPRWQKHDLRWRAHICVWAATQALKNEGDLVECGVDTAVMSGTILRTLDFASIPRTFWLFDTFKGIPFHNDMNGAEVAMAQGLNTVYFDSYEFVRQKTAEWPNVKLVRGILPETLDAVEGRKIAYLSIDLNTAHAEFAVMERLWPQLSPGAIVVIDDYAFHGHERQHAMWDAFADKHALMIATLPTGQGLLIKP